MSSWSWPRPTSWPPRASSTTLTTQLNFLFTYYPQTPGLAESRQSYLYISSAAAFRQQKFDEALALLEELHAQNASYKPAKARPPCCSEWAMWPIDLIADHVQKQDYSSARALLARLTRHYRAENEPFAKKWREQLEQLAATSRDEAQAHLAAGRFVEAHDAASAMQAIWPDIAGGAELAAEVARRHSLVRVGVDHPALFHPQAQSASDGLNSQARSASEAVNSLARAQARGSRAACTTSPPAGRDASSSDCSSNAPPSAPKGANTKAPSGRSRAAMTAYRSRFALTHPPARRPTTWPSGCSRGRR